MEHAPAQERVGQLLLRVRGDDDDRPLAGDIELVAAAIRDGGLIEAVEGEVGELA